MALATALGQNPPAPVPGTREALPPQAVVQTTPEKPPMPDAKRIDLHFKGGTPRDLIAAMGAALGKEVNAVIGDEGAKVKLPEFRVRNATVADIFEALGRISKRSVKVPLGGGSYQQQIVQSQFLRVDNTGDDTLWSFVSNEAEVAEALEKEVLQKRQLQHFQLGEYLSDRLTIEDITTALQTGWEMVGAKEMPDLKFHPQTGILIVAGDPKLLDQIPDLLKCLPKRKIQTTEKLPPPL
jgi:hypothetical protein